VEVVGVADGAAAAVEIGFVTGTACAAVASGGKSGTGAVIAAELRSGGSKESDFGGKEIGAAVAEEDVDNAAEGAVGVGVQVDAPVGAEGVAGVVDGVDGGTDIPGGGAATASGSSISSNGKSGSCSSKGETGTPAKPFGTAGLADAPIVAGAVVNEPDAAEFAAGKVGCGPVVANSSRGVSKKSVDEVVGCEDPVAAEPVAAVPVTTESVPEPAASDPALAEPTWVEPAVIEPAPAEPAVAEPVATEPARADPAEPIADVFAAGEFPPTATPTGLIAFLVPAVAASFDDVPDDDALREAAPAVPDTFEGVILPVGTPTGLEVPAEAGADLLEPVWVAESVDAAVLDLLAPALVEDAELEALTPAPEAESREVPAMAPVAPAEPSLLVPTPPAEPNRVAAVPPDATRAPTADPSRAAAPAEATPAPAADPSRAAARAEAEPVPAVDPPRAVPVEFAPAPAALPRDGVVPAPLVPSVRAGAPGSETPNSTSGSSSSADAISVGTSAESGCASGITDPDAADGPEASGPKSSNAPCASKSSSESIGLFEDGVVADADVDGGVAVEEVRPVGDPFTAKPIGSSTGRSAKGSKAGREAASIVFEPQSRRSILTVSCNASAGLPRRWLTDRQGRPDVVTCVTLFRPTGDHSALQKSDVQSSILPPDQVQSGGSASVTSLTRIVGRRRLSLSRHIQ
jgi:hypothetical protein